MSDTENTKSNEKAPGEVKTIKFYMNEETKPVIENDERRKNSIFKEQYKKAEFLVCKFLKKKSNDGSFLRNKENCALLKDYDNDFLLRNKDNCAFLKNKKDELNNCSNNIIAFIGERGSGKTSCMKSFAKSLPNNSSYKEKSFHVLEELDPSFFETNSNILELLIARMYNQFSEDRDRYENKEFSYDASKDLINAFQELQKSLQYCNKEDIHLNLLEQVSYLGESERIKERLYETIKYYLRWYGKEKLVISIDDIDLNVSQAYKMVEQIRKYLILPNVILLMAVKLEQLDNVIQQQMLKENEVLINRGVFAASQVSGMAEKYLDKLIPHDARVYLPNEVSFLNRPVQLVEKIDEKEKGEDFISLREAIPSLIFRKCRYLFYNTKGRTSLIIPRNLRELRLLLSMLNQMEDFKNNEESFYNKELFKNFFFNTWTDCLGDKKRLIAQPLINEDEPTLFNSKVVQLLYTYFFTNKEDKDTKKKDNDKLLLSVPDELKDIFDTNNITYNISLGDAFAVLNYIEKRKTDKETQSLVFFIKSLYSIRLYEYYDELPDFIKKEEERKKKKKEETEIKEVERPEELENYSNYQKLIGGNFYNLKYGEIIPPSRENKEERGRAARKIDGDKLNKYIRELAKTFRVNKEEIKDLKALHLVEFFILTSGRYFQSKDKTNESTPYRTSSPAYYDKNLSALKNIYFDALAPIFNLIDLEKTYKRFTSDTESDIYTIAQKTEGSLLNQIYYNSEEKEKYISSEFLSQICLRNAEVIDYLEKCLKDNRDTLNKGDNKKHLEDFYNLFKTFKIDTYDIKSKTEHHSIFLKPFAILGDILTDIDVDRFNAIFGGSSYWNLIFDNIMDGNKGLSAKTFNSNLKKNAPEISETLNEEELKEIYSFEWTYKNRKIWEGVFEKIIKKHEAKKAELSSTGINNTNSSTSSDSNS